jgi:hypothetical protein
VSSPDLCTTRLDHPTAQLCGDRPIRHGCTALGAFPARWTAGRVRPQGFAQDLVECDRVGPYGGIDGLRGLASSVAEVLQGASSVGAKALAIELRERRTRS